jgi:hypothetical protein
MFKTWDLSTKKWLYWIGMVGFVGTLQWYVWLIALLLYVIFDREKGKTENYQIEKAWMKFAIVAGTALIIFIILSLIFIKAMISYMS